MSLNAKKELVEIAKLLCRDLRKRSTKAEEILWEQLRNRKLDNKKFYRQYPIFYDITGKESFFIADFFCFETKLVIELDGVIHDYRLNEDLLRTEILNLLGLTVIRFKNDDIEKELEKVLDKIKSIR
ncbi:MAG: endonuclease domain-containing protein [Melioribacteraceae bacterium]